jgi:predicted DNA-binding transcriptional regulator YafY
MAATGERLLELLALFQSRHHWHGHELTQRLGISERTLRRDIDRIRKLGYPVDADRGVDGGYRLGHGARLPPLLINRDEAVAIVIGLRHAASQPIAGIDDAVVGALAKIVDILPPAARADVEVLMNSIHTLRGPAPAVDLDVLAVVARATRDSERTRFDYRAADDVRTERYVEPHAIVAIDRRWYLAAWDLDRGDWRIFRLDRITEPHVTKRRFEPRTLPASDATTFVTERLASLPTTYGVEVTVAAPVEHVQHHLGPWGTAVAAGPDTTRLLMEVDDLSWVVLILAALNADIRSAEPPELFDLLHTLGRRFSAVAP